MVCHIFWPKAKRSKATHGKRQQEQERGTRSRILNGGHRREALGVGRLNRLRIKRWKAEQKSPTDTLSFDDSDKRWLAYLRAHVGNLELLPAIVTHWERTAKPITRPLKVEELCKAFVLYRQSKGLDKATSPRTVTSPNVYKNIWAATWPTNWELQRSVPF
jgi:hypothetical protein